MYENGTRVYIGKKHAHEMCYFSVAGKNGTVTGNMLLSLNGRQTRCYQVLPDDDAPHGYQWVIHREDVMPLKPEHLGNYTNEDVLCVLENKEPF